MPSSPVSDRETGASGRADAPAATPDREPSAGGGEPPARDEQLEELRAQNARLEDRWKRALADLDNYRKRAQREVEWRVGEAREALLADWLAAIDSVERALQMASPDEPLYAGVRALLEQLEASLARHGVTRLGAAGEPFDPERHEVVAVRDTDELPDRTVVEVARSGFALGDRVLRPAQVVVARGPAAVPE
jgi:molecular chaperone GrpE